MFEKLFEPSFIKNVRVKNRIAFPGTGLFLGEDGCVTQRFLDFYEARAKGGAGILMVGMVNVDPEPVPREMVPGLTDEEYRKKWVNNPILDLYSDEFIPGLRKLVDMVHSYGTTIGIQFSDLAMAVGAGTKMGRRQLFHKDFYPEREITAKRLQELVELYAAAAERGKRAGFDFLEFMATGVNIMSRVLSHVKTVNPGVKGYCEDAKARARYLVELVTKSRQLVGDDYPIAIRMFGHEYHKEGYGLKESKEYAKMFVDAGCDAINVTGGGFTTTVPQFPMLVPSGAYSYLAKGIKEATNVPVFASVNIGDVYVANSIVCQGEADFVNMSRPLIADPNLPNKAREGRVDDIVSCICCSECLERFAPVDERTIDRAKALDQEWVEKHGGQVENYLKLTKGGVCCTVNPEAGYERERKITPALKKKKVMIVGGGPAGMEAARVLKLRGHEVTLYEKDQELGKTMYIASLPPGREKMALVGKDLSREIRKLGVGLKTGSEVSSAVVEKEKPDVLIIAAGGVPKASKIPGINKWFDAEKAFFPNDVLLEKISVGKKVVVIGGGGVGTETAGFIAKKGAMRDDIAMFLANWGGCTPDEAVSMANISSKQVTIVDMKKIIGDGIGRFTRWAEIFALKRWGVEMITSCEIKEINDRGIVIVQEGKERLIEADTIVVATGTEPNHRLIEELQDKAPETYVIGNAKNVGHVFDALHEGSVLARKI